MFKNDVELLMMLSRGAPTPATALGTDTWKLFCSDSVKI
jgi:hypothetical protein